MKTPSSDDGLGQIRETAERLYQGQLARWGLTCAREEWDAVSAEIANLRERVYRDKLPHMVAEGLPVDADDRRAHHFVARRDGVAVAALRLLPAPFEAEALFPDLKEVLRPDGRYIELGRLVGKPDAGEVGAARVLSLHALVWGLHQQAYDGLIAYARERASRHFRMLGMQLATRNETIAGKANEPYVLLVSHLDNTMDALGLWG